MKNILITGSGSYVGTSLEKWLLKEPNQYTTHSIDMTDNLWRKKDFSQYDVVFHVAGIAHIKETKENQELYFKVNRDLAFETARKAKNEGVKQFIFMSTMSVYGTEGKIGSVITINKDTPTNPKSNYGKSKLEAEFNINQLADDKFKVAILRPPIIYGPNCPGNYARLYKMALQSPIFPMVKNVRSMLSIDNLCRYVEKYINEEAFGLFFPQDDKYINTSLMVKAIAEENGKNMHLSRFMGWLIVLIGKRIGLLNKVFGNLVYEKAIK